MWPGIVVLLAALLAPLTSVFQDVTAGSGISFILQNSASPKKHQIETMPGGVALLDYDGDGRLDMYFANGARQPVLNKPDASWHNRLYRNLGNWKFEDVTARAGVAGTGFHFGVAAADYDNDGRVDLFVTGMPVSILYRNKGDGVFEDVTAEAGVGNRQQWPVAAGWFDYNNDGHLDLLVVNYVKWDPATEPFCGDSVAQKYRTYCHPKHYSGLPNTLFRNNGNGTFTDISADSGILKYVGKGMGVAFADFDADSFTDIVIANDTVPNFLFRNNVGRLTDIALEAGIAYNEEGRALSSMGVDFRDLDNDGREDLFVTALSNETFPVFRSLGKGQFLDVTYPSGVGSATLPFSGWSNGIYDLDNDGRKDLFAANGDVQDNTEQFSSRTSKQVSMALMQSADGKFRAVPSGPAGLHRGAAFGDLDGNGTVDVVMTRIGEPAVLLKNALPPGNWIGLRLRGVKSNRDGLGARVRIKAGGVEQWNHATTAVGYASSSAREVHFGLGAATAIEELEIRWPSGVVQRVGPPKINAYLDVTESAP